MVYKVIGLMSGSSLDGLDIAYVQLEEVRGTWTFSILKSECIPYDENWVSTLRSATDTSVADFLKLHTTFGRYTGIQVASFISRHDLAHKVHFIASHGHTVFHEPHNNTTYQIGDGASIAAIVGLPVITDLRSMDVALGGQGAPIVPIADRMLFGNYDYLLNLGGIANITIQNYNGSQLAFDICPANQALNALAKLEGKLMDEGGQMAAGGTLLQEIATQLSAHTFYQQTAPKSLSNAMAMDIAAPCLSVPGHNTADLLHTMTVHIAKTIADNLHAYPHDKDEATLLVTGGGAFNTFLIEKIQELLEQLRIKLVVPDAEVINYKEAMAMALIGTLRWREEVNVFSSVTGAEKDSVGGALWLP
jgi:anhydro-N-acetylmuramic acid kinase